MNCLSPGPFPNPATAAPEMVRRLCTKSPMRRMGAPAMVPVTVPSFTAYCPFTNTCTVPSEYWRGLSYVAFARSVFRLNTARSAKKPGFTSPRSGIP